MAKSRTDELRETKNAESAIRSLYDKFKRVDTRYGGCPDLYSKETRALKKKIKSRKDELEKDPKLVKLEKELTTESCRIAKLANDQRDRVDELLRQLQVRGLSPDLLDQIELMSEMKPAYVEECSCDDED